MFKFRFSMKRTFLVLGIWVFSGAWTLVLGASESNTLSDSEKHSGWKLLFDGKTFDGWRSFRTSNVHSNWVVSEGCLHHVPKDKGGHDLISDGVFGDFELEWDWKIAPKANSGLKYFVDINAKEPLGFEYQMIDDDHWDKTGKSLHDTIKALPRFTTCCLRTTCTRRQSESLITREL